MIDKDIMSTCLRFIQRFWRSRPAPNNIRCPEVNPRDTGTWITLPEAFAAGAEWGREHERKKHGRMA